MSSFEEFLSQFQVPSKRLAYGTAGFRDKHDILHSTFFRMGLLASLRSQCMHSQCIGAMITASHNPECDNGIKLVDANGGMLEQSWEPFAEDLANNGTTFENITEIFNRIVCTEGENFDTIVARPSYVVIGRDSRPHSSGLSDCVRKGVQIRNGCILDLGEVTTPQLHFVVQMLNSHGSVNVATFNAETCLKIYINQLMCGYEDLRSTARISDMTRDDIVIDASCGIGGRAATALASSWQQSRNPEKFRIDIRNAEFSGPVNDGCGAEMVQKSQRPPKGVCALADQGRVLCSYDGDADRIVFHCFATHPLVQWILLDGDKIAALVALFLSQEMTAAGLGGDVCTMGVVQTAYANGASTVFLKSKGVHVAMAKTGVKFLHHKALEFDVGVYFEANGHGTVLFSDKFTATLARELQQQQQQQGAGRDDRRLLALHRLEAATRVINQAVGDALSDMLLCLAVLQVLELDICSWHALYSDLPSKQTKLAVANKSLIVCSEDETTALGPAGLQEALDQAMRAVPHGRCFVRPSGTEDVVRVYAEAASDELADALAKMAEQAILSFVG